MGAKVKLRKKDRKYLERWLADVGNREASCPFNYIFERMKSDQFRHRYCDYYCSRAFPHRDPMQVQCPCTRLTEAYVVRKVRKLLEEGEA